MTSQEEALGILLVPLLRLRAKPAQGAKQYERLLARLPNEGAPQKTPRVSAGALERAQSSLLESGVFLAAARAR